MEGRIITWAPGARFGWIAVPALRTRGVFLHRKEIVSGEPAEGRRVSFTLADHGRGPRAEQAAILGEEEPSSASGPEPAYRVPEIEDYLRRVERDG